MLAGKEATGRPGMDLWQILVLGVVRLDLNAAELKRESDKKFVALCQQHSAVGSEINSLEHHGLNWRLDVGLPGYLRYVGYGGDELQPACDRAGVAGAGMSAGQAGTVGDLKPHLLKPQAKVERGGVATAGES